MPSLVIRVPLEAPVEIVVEGADEGARRRAVDWATSWYPDLVWHVLALRRHDQAGWDFSDPEDAAQATFDHPRSRYIDKTVAWVAEHDDSEPHYLTWYLEKGLDERLKAAITTYLRACHPELLPGDLTV